MSKNKNYRIDNLQYCNWSREIFESNREAGLDAIHVTIAYHEDYDEVQKNFLEWKGYFETYSELIFQGRSYLDIEKANIENKTAVFFGFVNCPDVCPMTLANIDQVIEKLNDDENKKLKVFFVSIDPERDSPELIKDYLASFKNKIYGITGDPEKIFLLSKSWGVLSEKIFNEDGTYLINHSSSILLLNNGKYIDRISHHENLDNIFKIIKKYL